jgi:hypothetical protein
MSLEAYFAGGFAALASLLLSIAVWQLRALGRVQNTHGEKLVRIETVLTGPTGDNGAIGNLRELERWRREIEEYSLPRRLAEIERRSDLPGRRLGDLVL